MSRLVRARRGEEGSALILALFFTVIFFVLLEAVMTFAEVGLKSTKAFQSQLTSSTATSGAVDAAINKYRVDPSCTDGPAPMTPDATAVGGQNVVVHCAATRSTNRPDNALLAVGPDSNEGIVSTAPGVQVRGNVFSGSRVAAAEPNSLAVGGDIGASGPCDANVTVDTGFSRECSLAGSDPRGNDPDFTKPIDAVPVRRVAPDCPPSGQWLAKLQPGYYDDPAKLSHLTDGSCPNAVVWLQPGVYYFDFGFLAGGSGPDAGVWTMNDDTVNVVAGTPTTWDPAAAARPTLTVPGGCKTDADSPPVDGVQVVMGGKSRLEAGNGAKVELCAQPSTTDQQIALYGLKPEPAVHTLAPSVALQVDGFRNTRNAFAIGPPQATADAQVAPSGPTSASLQLGGFTPSVPDGAVVNAVTLRVAHRDEGVAAATVTFPGNTCPDPQPVPLHSGSIVEFSIDLKACGITTPAQLAGLTVTYEVTALASPGTPPPGTDNLDGVVVDVDYTTPVTRKAIGAAGTSFSDPSNAVEIGDGAVATATLADGGPATASLTLSGFGDPPIPDNSTINSAVLRIAHQDSGDIQGSDITVSLPGVGTCSNLALSAHPASIGDDRKDVKACGLDNAAAVNGLTVTYDVRLHSGGSSATDVVDGIWLELGYSPPPAIRNPAQASSVGFSNPDNAKAIGEQPTALTSDATLSDGGPATASLTVGDFHVPTVSAGSYIDSARLKLVHQYTGDAGTATITVSFPGNTCPPLPVPTGSDPTIDLKTCGLKGAYLADPSVLTSLTATYDVGLAPGTPPLAATDKVDGIELDLTYRPSSQRNAAAATTTGFSDPDNAKAIGEQPTPLTAEATLTAGTQPSATLTVNDFGTPPVPAGSAIDSAVLRVVHHYTGDAGAATVTASFTGNTCGPLTVNPALDDLGVDLMPCGLSGAALANSPSLLAGLSATYQVGLGTSSTSASDSVDGLVLEVVFRAPTIEPLSGCLDHAAGTYDPGTPTTTCALLTTTAGAAGDRTLFAARGTIYAPSAAVDISMADVPSQMLTRGIIARTIYLGVSASGADHSVAVPPSKVELTAYPSPPPATRGPVNASSSGFSNPDNAKVIGEDPLKTSDAHLGGADPSTATLTVNDFSLPVLPPSSAIDYAVLRVSHSESGNGGSATVTASIPATSFAPPKTCSSVVAPAAMFVESRIDLRSCGLTISNQLAGLSVDYLAGLTGGSGTGIDRVDGVVLDVIARPASQRQASTPTSSGFDNPDNALVGGGPTSDATLDATNGPVSASVTLGDFGPLPVPAGSAIDSAILHVTHDDDPTITPITVTASFEGNTFNGSHSLTPHSGMTTDDIDLRKDGLSDPAALSGLSVTYEASLSAGTATDRVDSITLDVTVLSGPTLRATAEYDPETDHLVVSGWSVIR